MLEVELAEPTHRTKGSSDATRRAAAGLDSLGVAPSGATRLAAARRSASVACPVFVTGLQLGAWLMGCSSGLPGARPGETEAPHCTVRLPSEKPVLTEAKPATLPLSTLVVRASVTRQALLSELIVHIPETLAHENGRPIGAPGNVTYTVKRGAVSSRILDGALEVTTLANADIQVCKPLGPFCVTYGNCQPVLATRVALPLLLSDEYGWRRPSTSVRAERGCRIMGFDVTERLTSIAESNLASIQRRIEQSLPEIKPWAERLWGLADNPVFLDAKHCLRLVPQSFLQSAPSELNDTYEHALGVELNLVLTENCSDKPEARRLPFLGTRAKLPRTSTLWLTQELPSARVGARLTKAFQGRFGDEKVEKIEVLTRETGGTGKLVLGVTLDGKTCGTAWLTSDLKASDDQSLELQNLEFTSPRAAKALPGLVKHLSRASVLAPDFPFGDAAKRLEQIVESLTLLTSTAELQGQSALRQHQPVVKSRWGVPKVKGAQVGDTGVVAFAELELELGLALEPKLADKPE